MALNRSDKSRILRRYFPGMTRNSEISTEPSITTTVDNKGTLSTSLSRPAHVLASLVAFLPRSDLRPKTDRIKEASL